MVLVDDLECARKSAGVVESEFKCAEMDIVARKKLNRAVFML